MIMEKAKFILDHTFIIGGRAALSIDKEVEVG